MENKVPVEIFLAIVRILNGKAETITDIIDNEPNAFDLFYDTIIAFGFDGTSNIASIVGVWKKFSEKANKDVLYIHCIVYIILLLAATSCKNQS